MKEEHTIRRASMEIICEKTDRSPLVSLDGDQLQFSGRSYMDNAVEFYRNLIAKISSLTFPKLDVEVRLEYFNTSSSKCLLELFRSFEKMAKAGCQVSIYWYYMPDCPDLEEAGEDYRDLITAVPFELIEVEG